MTTAKDEYYGFSNRIDWNILGLILLHLSIFYITNRTTELNRKFTPRLISKFARLFCRRPFSNVN
jgi:hypothetical protein